jgi:integrase
VILTAARTGEVLGMTWDEIDGDVWTIPAARYKTRKTHSVPLSATAVALLKTLSRDSQYVFATDDKPMSNMAMAAVLKRMKIAVTVHGFRSSISKLVC